MISPAPWRLALLSLAAACALACGCSQDPYGLGDAVPVVGTVTLKGKPFRLKANAFARVWFHPDAAHGNSCPQIPLGDIDADGHYRLATRGRDGAPPGWYKVMVIATENIDPNRPSKRRPSFVPRRYGNPDTSGLRIQVVAAPSAGAYHLVLKD